MHVVLVSTTGFTQLVYDKFINKFNHSKRLCVKIIRTEKKGSEKCRTEEEKDFCSFSLEKFLLSKVRNITEGASWMKVN